MIRFRPAAALALALIGVAPFGAAMASPDMGRESRRNTERPTPANAVYDAAAAISAVHGAGYTAVSDLEWEHGGWQVKAADGGGRHVELRVDAATGAVSRGGR